MTITILLFILFIYLLMCHPVNIYENLHIKNLIKYNKNPYNSSISEFFKISIYKSNYEANNFMLIIYPQEYHFFIENEQLIYHPNNEYLDGILKQYFCNNDFEFAYNLHLNVSPPIPKVICHKKLKYLKTNIYANESMHTKTFDELQNPINAIKIIIGDIIKNNEG